MNKTELYKPIILEGIKIDGIALRNTRKGDLVEYASRKFVSSHEKNFDIYANQIYSAFGIENLSIDRINGLLVIIKPDNTAEVYKEFPLSIQIVTKKSLQKFEFVELGDAAADIIGVFFNDDFTDLNPSKGDQIVWLFRYRWHFGLYFDFSCQQYAAQISEDLAYCFKRVLYQKTFSFLSESGNLEKLISDGWFPFIRLPKGLFDNLVRHYEENDKTQMYIDSIIGYFNKEVIESMVDGWWRNPVFLEKKEILLAGIVAFLRGGQADYISCIKILISEVEGIIRSAYKVQLAQPKPSLKQLKDYLIEMGKNKFSSQDTLGFPSEFMIYLSNSIFKGFDHDRGDIPDSRHSVVHGVADVSVYTDVRALQIILTIDQVNFFLGTRASVN